MTEKYYIGGKQYIPEESHLLCDVRTPAGYMDLFADEIHDRIYATKNGGFFHIREEGQTIQVEVLSPKKAMELLDAFSPYIDTDVYDMVLGTPEKG